MIFAFWKFASIGQRRFPAMKGLYKTFTQGKPFQTQSSLSIWCHNNVSQNVYTSEIIFLNLLMVLFFSPLQ
jgi:hypothetical protein